MGIWIKESFGALAHPLLLMAIVIAMAIGGVMLEAPGKGVMTIGSRMAHCAQNGVSSFVGHLGCNPADQFGPGGLSNRAKATVMGQR